METAMILPASYNVMSYEEMTYTEGGANANALEAVCAWLVPFYGWFKGSVAARNYRKANPNTWLDTGLDALSRHMEGSTMNLIYDIGCAVDFVSVCATGIGLIPTAAIILL